MTTIKIKGMTCQHCVMAVTKVLSGHPDLREVKVDLGKGEATFEEIKPVDREIVKEMVKRAGYEVG